MTDGIITDERRELVRDVIHACAQLVRLTGPIVKGEEMVSREMVVEIAMELKRKVSP